MSLLSKIKNNLMTPHELRYLHFCNQPIQRKAILLEGAHGRGIEGHIYALATELVAHYPEYQVRIAVQKTAQVPTELQDYCVEHLSSEYLKCLATSEILINDTSFWAFFHKRPEQKYYLFWHGTPLKCLGKATQVQGYGNVQRNLAAADLVLVNNEFTKDKLAVDFGIAEIVDNAFVVAPSPRNAVLFDQSKVVPGRYVYMPTWRDDRQDVTEIRNHLSELDRELTDGEELYVKLHPYEAAQLDIASLGLQKVKAFPAEQEVYQFLATTEKLITDYSSIMFDFAVTGREIVLFTCDQTEYEATRGLYFPLAEVPFPQVATVSALVHQLHHPGVADWSELNQRFNPYDFANGTQVILQYLLQGEKSEKLIHEYPQWNGKDNVLIYAYKFDNNGITNSLLNLLSAVDLSKRNYILTWPDGLIEASREAVIRQLPAGVHTFIEAGKTQATVGEMLQTFAYMAELPSGKEKMAAMYRRDFQRIYPNLKVTNFVHYPGYDRSYAVWTWALQPLGIQTMIVVHTDMEQEFQVNRSLKQKVIFDAYRQANHVVCVSQTIGEKIKKLVPEASVTVMNVLLNPERVRLLAQEPLPEEIPQRLLNDFGDDRVRVFINIGRFSKQKGLDRLVTAFEQLADTTTRLVIIGSYGPEEAAIKDQIANSKRKDDIYLFSQLAAPYNLVAAADCFVFSSRYEGFGMVVFESLALGTPVVMTAVPETVEALDGQPCTLIVENSTEGILEGMQAFLKGEVPKAGYDFVEKTEKSLAIWENLLKK
ncbi:CDP-glycerol glycerophosphotransferase family protein [Enterococcus sp.]|uniref:CDP-glycerol glycerophosphotransferase family protein n=1 Tax=Enterococcus sp. TaxID=35783 RepID=UPI003C731769